MNDRFCWLHFTDLHVGMGGEDHLWSSVEQEVLADLGRVHQHLRRVDAIFFTGDLTQRGDSNEFRKFNTILEVITKKLSSLGSSPVFIAIPGNHDLIRPTGGAVLDGLKSWTDNPDLQRRFWTEPASDYRKAVAKAFNNWSSWSQSATMWESLADVNPKGELPGDFAATWEHDGIRVGLLGLNTAALQLADGDYRGRLSVHPKQVTKLVGRLYEWVEGHDACFLLTHHDRTWLDIEGLKAWNGDIAKPGHFVVHLCGHRHEQKSSVLSEGGAMPRRTIIGRSLFGLATFNDNGQKSDRLHGYSAGCIEFKRSREMRRWPRRDELQQGGHRQIRADQSEELAEDQGTPSSDLGPSPRQGTRASLP